MPSVGDRIAARYVLRDKLGAGGMGHVFEARDERLGRTVALKVLPPDRATDEKARARLLREARSAAGLEHAGIIEVYDVGELDDGGVFVVMERVRGQSLRDAAETASVEERMRWLGELADALDAAHAAGVIHRDVKPENAMLRDDGRVVLLDFGLAQGATLETDVTVSPGEESLTASGAILGTPAYLAPEQARGRAEPASDRWALAVMAYELLSGRRPFDAAQAAPLLAQILTDDPSPASEVGLPAACDAVFARGLAKTPEERPATCRAFVRALEAAVSGELDAVDLPALTSSSEAAPTVAAAPSGTRSAPLPRWVPVGLAVGLIAAGAAVWWWNTEDAAVAEPAPRAAPALTEDTPIACAIWETPDEPDEVWLGAAAAHAMCAIVRAHRGAYPGATIEPFQLLGLPFFGTEDTPHDPLNAQDARPRSIAAAQTHAAWVDGTVREAEGSFELHARLHVGERVSEATATGESLLLAARSVMARWIEEEVFPERPPVPAVVRWEGIETVAQAEATALAEHTTAGETDRTVCDAIFGTRAPAASNANVAHFCEREPLPTPAPTDGDLPARARHLLNEVEPDRARLLEVADALAEARGTLDDSELPWARVYEALLRSKAGETEQANALFRVALPELSTQFAFTLTYGVNMLGTSGAAAVMRSQAYVFPVNPESWRSMASFGDVDDALELAAYERAHRLAPTIPYVAFLYAVELAKREQWETIRTLAARLRTSHEEATLVAHGLSAILEAKDGRFAAAHRRLTRAFEVESHFGDFVDGDLHVASILLELGEILGRCRETANAFLERFAVPERLVQTAPHYEILLLMATACADLPLARRALDIIERMRPAHGGERRFDTVLRAARARVEQDVEGMRAALREAIAVPGLAARCFPRELYTSAPELIAQLDAAGPPPASSPWLRATLRDVRAAQRCEATEDHECARLRASRVVEAWEHADADVPAVTEMRALLARLPDAP